MVCKIIFCSEFPDIPDKAGRKMRRRRRTQAIAKRYAFHENAKKECNQTKTKRRSTTVETFVFVDYDNIVHISIAGSHIRNYSIIR